MIFNWCCIYWLACNTQKVNTSIINQENNQAVVVDTTAHQEELERQQLQLAGLKTFVESTSFSAVISNILIETKSDRGEDFHIVKAQVEQLFRGTTDEYIEFELYTEPGESVYFDKRVLIFLCQQNEQLFWAGTGSVFPATEVFITQAKNTVEKLPDSSASFCD